jgi:hypothetical protein
MSRRFFKITTDGTTYICREGSYDMYRLSRRQGAVHVPMRAPALADLAEAAGYVVEYIEESELWPHKLWKGSFMRSKEARA